jgi:hypothetical protein
LPVESEATDVSIVTEGVGGAGSEGVIADETGIADWETPFAGVGMEGARLVPAVRPDGLLEVSDGLGFGERGVGIWSVEDVPEVPLPVLSDADPPPGDTAAAEAGTWPCLPAIEVTEG